MVLAAAASALAVAVVVVVMVPGDRARRDGGGLATIGRAGSELVDRDPSSPLPIGDVPVAYRITYRVEAPIEGEIDVSTEELAVRRPFDTVVRSYRGERAEGVATSGRIASFGRFAIISGTQELVLASRPGVSPSDVRLDPVLRQALVGQQLEAREQRQVAGRPCQVYRSLDPLGSGSITPATSDQRYTDTCLDGAGLVLEDVVVAGGDVLVRRLATEVEVDPHLTDDDFEITAPTIDVNSGGGSLLRMAEGSRPPGTFWELAAAPAGFTHCGRFSYVAPREQPDDPDDPLQEVHAVASAVDVWVRGADVLVVDQGAPLRGPAPFALGAPLVDLGDLGDGDVVLGTQGASVRALLGGGRFLRVIGTLPSSELIEVARSLEEVEGGTLEVVQGTPTCDG